MQVEKHEPAAVAKDNLDELDPTTRALVRATNRNTHAVRSLAVFFFTWLKVSIFGGALYGAGLWALSALDSNPLGMILIVSGLLTILIGLFLALNNGLDELEKSEL